MNKRSLQGVMALTSMAIPPPHLPSQSDTNGIESAQKTPAHSTPHFPLAPACSMATTVQQDPTVMLPSSSLPPSP